MPIPPPQPHPSSQAKLAEHRVRYTQQEVERKVVRPRVDEFW